MSRAAPRTHIRSVWLRRGVAANLGPGSWQPMALPALGIAAARETLLTQTVEMAGIWTDLFRGMLTTLPN